MGREDMQGAGVWVTLLREDFDECHEDGRGGGGAGEGGM